MLTVHIITINNVISIGMTHDTGRQVISFKTSRSTVMQNVCNGMKHGNCELINQDRLFEEDTNTFTLFEH